MLPALVRAQQYYVRGEVKDEAGNPLPNVTILQHSTGYLFRSGMEGTFGLNSRKKIDTLTFSLKDYFVQKVVADATANLSVILKKDNRSARTSSYKLSSLTQDLARNFQQQWFNGDETYASIVENQFIEAAGNPSTMVTLNVDRAAYSNIRRFLNTQSPVPPDAVRIEEMLNYFNLNYTEPAGGKAFEITSTLTHCPWNALNELLLVNIRSRKIALDSLPPTHLVFLIDVSGSMDMPNRLPLLKAGFRGLVNNLRDKDSVSIVVYGGSVEVVLPATGGAEKEKIFTAINGILPGGFTPGESGIKMAYKLAREHFIRGGNNRVILATDGDFNVGLQKETELEALIKEQSRTGVYLTCLGVGMGNYKDSKIQALAQKGNGNFAYLDSYAEAEKVLMKEFLQTFYTVAEDAYLNVQFNPASVRKYRLIGFDNKMGAIKDTLSVVEGGVIGSAYSMLLAFEIEPAAATPGAAAPKQPVLYALKYRLPGQSKVWEEKVQPSLGVVPLEQLAPSYRFATALIQFGLQLRESRMVSGLNWNAIEDWAERTVNPSEPLQKEFLSLVQQAKAIYTKKKKKKDWPLGIGNKQ
ncbi:von Willebrand factor type A domain-containing protein [Paraflavisolibacter sp. H34]|uniref:vWA domain-containing protein n=1 Tax=Huijunlia imazamoxiresistens TaxID=3127457 RepID=UPI0030166BC9